MVSNRGKVCLIIIHKDNNAVFKICRVHLGEINIIPHVPTPSYSCPIYFSI